jgi:hypothetical protein
MELSSKLLLVGGYVAQYDRIGYAGFGDSAAMQAIIVIEKRLPFVLEEIKPCPMYQYDFFIVFWRKIAI